MTEVGIAELFSAVEEGNEVKVTELIAKGISPNSFKDESRITPLHYCTQVGDVQMFKLLLENKASLRKRDRWMDSVVHYACRYGNMHILELILKENSRQQSIIELKQQEQESKEKLKAVNIKPDSRQQNQIKLKEGKSGAPLENKLKVRKFKSNMINLKGKDSKLPISEAIIKGNILFVVMLYKAGAAIDITDQSNKAPIDLIFDLPSDLQAEIFEKLMTTDAKMEERNKFVLEICKYGGLHYSEKIDKKINEILKNFRQIEKEKWLEIFLQNDCVAEVKKLLQEPNYYTWNILQSVLKKAVQCSNEEIVRLVLNEHSSIFADEDCIKICIQNESIEILKYLLKFSAKWQSWKEYNITRMIIVAIETGNVDVVTVLFDQFHNPLDYVKVDANVWVKLIENKYEELFKYLLNAGVKLDDHDLDDYEIYENNKTPLTAAIESQNSMILQYTIAAIAKPSDPQYSLKVAIKTQNTEIVKLSLSLPGCNLNDHEITRATIQTKKSIFLANLIGLGLKLNFPDIESWSALTTAVETKDLKIVELVYNSGATFSNSKEEIWTAVVNCCEDILDFLLGRCSIVKLRDKSAWTPLHEAVMQDNLEMVKLLVKKMQQNEINISGKKLGHAGKHETPLSLAVLRKNIEITKYLISVGADIRKGGRNLFNAVVSGSEEIVIILLREGIPTHLYAKFNITILHVAVIIGNVNIIKQLLELNMFDINTKVDLSYTIENHFKHKYGSFYVGDIRYEHIKNETTPLQLAVRQNYDDITLELLNYNADITIANKIGSLPLVESLIHSNNKLLKIMLENYPSQNLDIDVNAVYKIDYNPRNLYSGSNAVSYFYWKERFHKHLDNGTLLHFAVLSGNLEGVSMLLEYGALVSQVDSINETAIFRLNLLLHDRDKINRIVKILVENGANINHVNGDGTTVLNEAVKYGNNDLVHILIIEGADINSIKDETIEVLLKSGRARSHKYFCQVMNIVNLLLQHGYHFQDVSQVADWLLSTGTDSYSYIYEKNLSKIQHIICQILDHMSNSGYDVTNKASTLLLTAAQYDLQILGKYLVSAGCDVNVSEKSIYLCEERHVIEVAVDCGNFDFMKILFDAGSRFGKTSIVRKVLETVINGVQMYTYCINTFKVEHSFNLENSFLQACNQRYEVEITILANAFDTFLKQDNYFEELYGLEYFVNSPIALSIQNKLPWAVQYFVQHQTLRNQLHSNAVYICKLFDLLLQNFDITTAKILVDHFGKELVQANPTIVHKLLHLRNQRYIYVTEKEVIDLTQSFIDKGLDINSQDDDGYTILHHAVVSNGEKVVKYLVESKCDVNCTTNKSYTALELAIHNGYYQCSDILLDCLYIKQSKTDSLILDMIKYKERNIDSNLRANFMKQLVQYITSASSYENLLKSAVAQNDGLTVTMLLNNRYEIYEESVKDLQSILDLNMINASKYHFVEVMEELINAGAEIQFEKRKTPLHYMCALPESHECSEKCFKILSKLIQQSGNTNMEDEHGKLPLHYAIVNLNYDATKMLLEAGSCIAPYSSDGVPTLSLYLDKINERYYDIHMNESIILMIGLLLSTEALALPGNKVPQEVIHDVIVHERTEVMFLFSKYKTHIEYKDSDGNTALHIACKHNHSKILAKLLDRDCEVNTQNNAGQSPLLLACDNGTYSSIGCVKLLIEHGAKLDIPDNIGITAIHMCIINRYHEAVILFINKSCDINKKTAAKYQSLKAGSTPLVTVLQMDRYDSYGIAEKLIDGGADVNICDEDGDSPLHKAAEGNIKEALLKKLISRSVNIDIQNNQGWSILHIAVKNQNTNIVQLILTEKSDVNAKIHDRSEEYPGSTALHIAVHHTSVSLVEMLLKAGGSMFIKDTSGKTCMDLCEFNEGMTKKLPLWPMLIKSGISVKTVMVNKDLVNTLQKSNLLYLLRESGCVLKFEGPSLLEPDGCSLLEIVNKQQQPLSLMRLAANTVRTNTHPNALYGSNKLPLPESIQLFICFDDSEDDVNHEVIQGDDENSASDTDDYDEYDDYDDYDDFHRIHYDDYF